MRVTPSAAIYGTQNLSFTKAHQSKKTKETENTNMSKPSFSDNKKHREQNGVLNIVHSAAAISAINRYKKDFTPESEAIYNTAVQIAKKYKSPVVEEKHIWLACLMHFDMYLKDIDDGKEKYEPGGRQKFPECILGEISQDSGLNLNEQKTRKNIQNITQKYISLIKNNFKKEAEGKYPLISNPIPSKKLIKELDTITQFLYKQTNLDTFFDSYYYMIAADSRDKNLKKSVENYILDLQYAIMTNGNNGKKKYSLDFYDKKADTVWKSADMGNDTIILCDTSNKSSVKYFTDSFTNLIKSPKQKYGRLNAENTEIIELNKYADLNFLTKFVSKKTKQNEAAGKTTVIIGDLVNILKASMTETDGNTIAIDANELQTIANLASSGDKNPYIKFVFVMEPESYYANSKDDSLLSNVINNYAVQTLPAITTNEAREYLTSGNGIKYIEQETGKNIDSETVLKTIDLTKDDKGNYPDKVLDLLNKVSKYYVNVDNITLEQVIGFMRETREITEASEKTDDIDIVYDTGKTLDDIAGNVMTKEAAQSVVNEIKNGIGTKGLLIYQSDYTSDGGGRRNTAEAIAGEARIPMITINARDFLMKDLSSLYQNPNLAELKIQTLFAKAKAQAKTSPNECAMIFIENFDNFAPDPYRGFYPSGYEQKAFSQLLAEMEKAGREEGANLLVIASVNDRTVIDNNIRKPGKFMDEIVIFPPQDAKERKEVFDYYIKKTGLKLKGNKEEQEETKERMAATAGGFSVVDIMYLLETAKTVSNERKKDETDRADLTEAFLRIMYGRANKSSISEHKKKIVASHEAGHALTLQIMYNVTKKQNLPWLLPDRVDFLTLDPRGYYGGAMYPKDSENDEFTFEKLMSELVCDYGGHSSEKNLYDFTGSYGITADMQMARQYAEAAVVDMGMGLKTGVRHFKRNILGELDVSEKQKQIIEEDEEYLLSCAEKISDKIVEAYRDFIEEFTQNHYEQVATGDCIITSDEFDMELNNWINKQSAQKRHELDILEDDIIKMVHEAKYGKNASKRLCAVE